MAICWNEISLVFFNQKVLIMIFWKRTYQNFLIFTYLVGYYLNSMILAVTIQEHFVLLSYSSQRVWKQAVQWLPFSDLSASSISLFTVSDWITCVLIGLKLLLQASIIMEKLARDLELLYTCKPEPHSIL